MKSRKFFKNNGITLVSLVVTIIVLIILAGTSINLLLGKNGIITMAKQAKENTELAKIEEETALNELYTQIEIEGGTSGGISYDAIAKLVEFKTTIADYIESKNVARPDETKDASEFINSFEEILTLATKVDESVAATADNISAGKKAWVNGQLITGIGNQSMVRTLIGSSDWKELGQKGWGQPANAAISYTNPIDVTDYNYLVLIYNRYNCYNQKMGFGLYDSSNPTYEQCLNATLQANESSTGTGSDTHTPRLLYIDISSVEGEKYPFVYLTSQMYGYILHFYLTNSTEIPTL